MIQKSSCKDILRRRSLGRRRCPHLKSLALIGAILSIASTPTLASDDVLFSSQIKDVSEAKFIDTFEGRGNLDQNELGGRVEASENVSWQREKTPYTFGRSLKLAVDLLDARSGWWKSDRKSVV